MATKPSDCQLFYKKSIFKAKHLPWTKDQIDYFNTYYVTSTWFSKSKSNLQMNYLNLCYRGNQNII